MKGVKKNVILDGHCQTLCYSSDPPKCTVKIKSISVTNPYPHNSNTIFLLLELSFNLCLLGVPSSNSSQGSVQRWNFGWGRNLSANSVQQGSHLPGLGKEQWGRERKRGNKESEGNYTVWTSKVPIAPASQLFLAYKNKSKVDFQFPSLKGKQQPKKPPAGHSDFWPIYANIKGMKIPLFIYI